MFWEIVPIHTNLDNECSYLQKEAYLVIIVACDLIWHASNDLFHQI